MLGGKSSQKCLVGLLFTQLNRTVDLRLLAYSVTSRKALAMVEAAMDVELRKQPAPEPLALPLPPAPLLFRMSGL